MKDLRGKIEMIAHLTERIDQRTERIDLRTEGHSGQLTSLAGLREETAKIARSLESLADKHAKRMFTLACIGLMMLTAIILLLISAYTKTPLSFGHDDKGLKLSAGEK